MTKDFQEARHRDEEARGLPRLLRDQRSQVSRGQQHHNDEEKDHYLHGESLYFCDQEVQRAFLSPVQFREPYLDEKLSRANSGMCLLGRLNFMTCAELDGSVLSPGVQLRALGDTHPLNRWGEDAGLGQKGR